MTRQHLAAPFVGRVEELNVLADALDAARAGQFVPVLVGGEAGVGKTRLVSEFVARLPSGTRAHWGRCTEEGGAAPFGPWLDVLRSLTGDSQDVAKAVGANRFVAFESVAALLCEYADRQPTLLVFDDLHVADVPSLELMRFLVRAVAEAPLLLIATHREHELRADPERDAILGDVARLGRRMTPPRLDRTEVEALLEGITGAVVPTAVVDAVLERTAGNALFVDETARVLASTGFESIDVMPDGVRAAVRARLRLLPSSCRSAVDAVAVLGSRTETRVLAALLELAPADLADRIEPAMASGIIVTSGPGRLSFSHGLVRDAVHDDLSPRERAGWHERAARTLLAVHATHLDPHAAGIAQHFADASLLTGEEPAAAWAARAAEVARTMHAHEEAAAWSTRAAGWFELKGDVTAQAEELARAADDLHAVGDSDGSTRRGRQVTDLARITGSGELLARAAMCRAAVFRQSRGSEAPTLLREALDHPDNAAPSRRRAELLTSLISVLGVPGVDGRAANASGAREARHELEAVVCAGVNGRDLVLDAYLASEHGPDSFADRPGWLAEYEQVVSSTNEPMSSRVKRTYWSASLAFESGRLGALRHALDDWNHQAEVLGVRYWQWREAIARASEAFAHGRFVEAEERARASLPVAGDYHREMSSLVVGGTVLAVRREQGRMLELIGSTPVEMLGPAAMLAHIERDDVPAAAALVADQRAEAERSPRDIYWLCLMAFLARGAAFIADHDTCAWVVDELMPFAGQFVMFGRCYLFGGPVSELIGVTANVAGRPEVAEDHLRGALEWAEREDAPGSANRVRMALATVMGDRGTAGQAERERLLRKVVEVGTRLGMSGLVAQAELSLDRPASAVDLDRQRLQARQDPRPTVRTFGTFAVIPAGTDEPVRWSSKKARDTLKLLVSRHGAPVLREELIELLWPGIELSRGRNRLSVVLSMVRSALDPDRRSPADQFLQASRDVVALRTDRLDVDLDRFLELAAAGLRGLRAGDDGATALLSEALDLCDGGFLMEDAYVDWPAAIRAAVASTHAEVLHTLAGHAEQLGERDAVILRLSQLLDLDPYDPRASNALVAALTAAGRHGDAKRQQEIHAARMADLDLDLPEPA